MLLAQKGKRRLGSKEEKWKDNMWSPIQLKAVFVFQMEVNFTRSGKNEEEAYNLTGLQAFTEYVVALQCVVHKSRFWSGWSQEKMGVTVEEGKLVPCGFFFACSGLGQTELSLCGFCQVLCRTWESWNPTIPEPESLYSAPPQGMHGTCLSLQDKLALPR